jgi:hypothetical protein
MTHVVADDTGPAPTASTAWPAAPGSGTISWPPAIVNSPSGSVNQPEHISFPSFPIELLGKC